MTAERQDGKTARPRASKALRASMLVQETALAPVAPPVEAAPPSARTVQPSARSVGKSKYTALLDDNVAAAFDELALRARRQLGRRVDKSQILATLIMLAADDASLREQVINQIGQAGK